ncbi:MAG: hypothetical protein NZ699_07880 [Roseiflexus sp.]|nr:hypothetical protein [Roseiflexus sp.]MCS7289035.1 hypothetical protein [Roseiflexus sp.]MDW8145346.1 hypothetical protein [Roseiflexaceae bacterium]MDW8232660.1 hypothetical protein [Roseiflexaceae bacterium]
MTIRFSRPRLIDETDPRYRAHVEQMKLLRSNQRAIRPPRARDLFGGEAEAALRDWLAQQVALSERRILEYMEHRGRQAITKYRELDAVWIPDPKTIHVFEIKASMKASSLRRAIRQLRDTQTILRMLFPRVHTTILLVDTGIPQTPEEAAAQLAEWIARHPDRQPPTEPPPTLADVLANLPQVRQADSLAALPDNPDLVGLIRFSVDDIIALAGAENLHLDWDEDEEEEEEEADAEPGETARYVYSSASESDDEDSPLAAALRKALRDRAEG